MKETRHQWGRILHLLWDNPKEPRTIKVFSSNTTELIPKEGEAKEKSESKETEHLSGPCQLISRLGTNDNLIMYRNKKMESRKKTKKTQQKKKIPCNLDRSSPSILVVIDLILKPSLCCYFFFSSILS